VKPGWIEADWDAPPGVRAGCSTRVGGLSRAPFDTLNLGAHVGDDPAAVAGNRHRLADEIALPSEPRWLTQVHGSFVAVEPAPGVEADASLTRCPGVVCAVLVADCLPVLMASADGGEVAAAHAGWRGLAAGVLENTVAEFDSQPSDIAAWLGPAISQQAFEVGPEVREAFLDADAADADCFVRNERGRWQADLQGLARRRLARAGVHRVAGGDFCTFGDALRFYSFRRDGGCGRLAALIWRDPAA